MVSCCVNGCSSTTESKNIEFWHIVSFHSFPPNPELRLKWLTAIGEANWSPPSDARICSLHFSADQLLMVKNRLRLQPEAVPVLQLPVSICKENKNLPCIKIFQMTDTYFHCDFSRCLLKILACRICLATNVKLHSLKNQLLKTCITNIMELNNSLKELPQYVCYECAALLIKSYRLVEKSKIAHATLLDIYNQYGMINIELIEKQNRSALNLKSSLQIDKNATEIMEYVYDEEENTPLIFIKSDPIEEDLQENKEEDITEEEIKIEVKVEEMELEEVEVGPNNYESEEDDGTDITVPFEEITNSSQNVNTIQKKKKSTTKRKNKKDKEEDLVWTRMKSDLQQHYTIVELSPEQQLTEFIEAEKAKGKLYKFECDICSKRFTTKDAIERHMPAHDPRRGNECPVCKCRYRVMIQTHVAINHQWRFHCRTCHKVFKYVRMAQKHYVEHTERPYKCAHCTFSSGFKHSLSVHRRRMHAGCRCRLCHPHSTAEKGAGETQLPNERELTDGVKTMTEDEGQKRNAKSEIIIYKCNAEQFDGKILTKCDICGLQYETTLDLNKHKKAEHLRRKKEAGLLTSRTEDGKRKQTWTMPGDQYPIKCDHCDTMLSCRKDHWAHVRKVHPKERANYKSVITAVCEVCGQGFQNAARLRLHELRHGPPTVPCAQCSKKFYDKFLLSVHMETHSELRPYRCHTCGRGFKTKSNLDKHHRTHSDVAAYECSLCGKKFKYSTSMNLHIRTVHHKIPLPPRKRRSKKTAPENEKEIISIKLINI